ncbi:MAG: glycosyltransferase [Candidatus Hodarchaeota archaeon]
MKIIFNSYIYDWFWQIYDEIRRFHEVILPENYKDNTNKIRSVDINALEKCALENIDADFIFDFRGELPLLIEWTRKNINIPLVLFDTNTIERPYKAKKTLFAYMWFVEKYAIPIMEKYDTNNQIYQGMAANPFIYHPLRIEKIYDVSFFGQHYGERSYWLNLIQKFCINNDLKNFFPKGHGVKLAWGFDDINRLYNQSKINLSFAPRESPGRIINLRTFEICMSGNFQLMQYTPIVEEYFEIGEEIICWKNKKELFEKICYYLENEDELKKVAEKGYKKAIKKHTWSKRFEKIEKFLKNQLSVNLSDFTVNSNYLLNKLNKNKIIKFQFEKNLDQTHGIFHIFKLLGYNLKRNIKQKRTIKTKLKFDSFFYQPELDNFYFVEVFGKIMMVVKILPLQKKINNDDWVSLKRIGYLTENLDLSIPNFGIITTGSKWLIYDFINKKWLKRIPNKKDLKVRINIPRYLILRILYYPRENIHCDITKFVPISIKTGIIRILQRFNL